MISIYVCCVVNSKKPDEKSESDDDWQITFIVEKCLTNCFSTNKVIDTSFSISRS